MTPLSGSSKARARPLCANFWRAGVLPRRGPGLCAAARYRLDLSLTPTKVRTRVSSERFDTGGYSTETVRGVRGQGHQVNAWLYNFP